MTQQSTQATNNFQSRKYVRGAFLYSTDDGTGYQQKNRNRPQDQIIIQDKADLASLKKQIQQKKQQINKKKEKAKKEKHMLIPIRDTPVEPLPEPSMDNKCERATQEQFQYFQTYISQKEKERKFQEDQRYKIDLFERRQEWFKQNQEGEQKKSISIVIQKDEEKGANKAQVKKKGPSIKVVIKKKQTSQSQKPQQTSKQEEKLQDSVKSDKKAIQSNQKTQRNVPTDQLNQPEKTHQHEQLQKLTKVRVIQQQNPHQT